MAKEKEIDKNESPLQKARACREEYHPEPNESYSWILNYARDQYRFVDDALAVLEEKAHSLIRYIGIGVPIVGAAYWHIFGKGMIFTEFCLLVGTVFGIISFYCALKTISPSRRTSEADIPDLFKITKMYDTEEKAKGAVATIIAIAVAKNTLKSQEKGRYIRSSFRWLFVAIVWLITVVPISYVLYQYGILFTCQLFQYHQVVQVH